MLPAVQALLAIPTELVREFMEASYNPLSLAVLGRVLELDLVRLVPEAGVSRADLARRLTLPPDGEGAFDMVLDLAIGFGFLEERTPGEVHLGRLARAFLVPGAPLPLRGIHERYVRALGAMDLLRDALLRIPRDNSVMYTAETSAVDQSAYFATRQSWDASNRAYFWDSAALLLRAVARCDLSRHRLACDVGAGPGAFAALLRRLHPQLRVVAADVAYQTEATRGAVRALLGPDAAELELRPFNFLHEAPPVRPDLLTLNRVFSGVPPRAHATWLARARAALAPGGRLLVTDFFYTGAPEHDRTVAMLFGLGKTWTYQRITTQPAGDATGLWSGEGWQAPMRVTELARAFAAAGFTDVRSHRGDAPFAVVEGTSPGPGPT